MLKELVVKQRNGIRTEINAIYRSKIVSWLSQSIKNGKIDGFPKRIYLGAPTHDDEVLAHKDEFLRFCKDWHRELPSGTVDFLKKNYQGIGEIDVPIHLVFEKPDELAAWAGHLVEYHSALSRLNYIKHECPELTDSSLDFINYITSFEENDFVRFIGVCKWLCKNRNSGKMIRQIPVRGVDSVWFESHRSLLIEFLREYLNLNPLRKDLQQFGLVPPSGLQRIVILDKNLREKVGGLRYLAATAEELNNLDIKPYRVFFFEDISTALSVPDIEGSVIVVVAPHSINRMCSIRWIGGAQCFYLGNIDLRSFAILNNIRVYLPRAESRLLDAQTVIENKEILSFDDISAQDIETPMALTAEEASLYRMLASGVFGQRARLDQERMPMNLILQAIGVIVENETSSVFLSMPSNDISALHDFDDTEQNETLNSDDSSIAGKSQESLISEIAPSEKTTFHDMKSDSSKIEDPIIQTNNDSGYVKMPTPANDAVKPEEKNVNLSVIDASNDDNGLR